MGYGTPLWIPPFPTTLAEPLTPKRDTRKRFQRALIVTFSEGFLPEFTLEATLCQTELPVNRYAIKKCLKEILRANIP